jgi:predicted CoA-binding protein
MQTNLYGTPELTEELLESAEVWAVVGLGQDQTKPAFGVAKILQNHGKKIIPIHPRAEEVHGEKGYKTLAEAIADGHEIDIVDCFVAAKRVGQIVDEAIELKLPAVWMQLEIIDEDAAQRAVDAGMQVVMDKCPAIEWRRLGK